MVLSVVRTVVGKVQTVYQMEKRKYEKRGWFANILGYTLLFTLIYLTRQIGIRVWPDHVEDKALFFLIGALTIHYSAETWTFLLVLPGYLNWWPSFYQKYKVNKGSNWPWERLNWPVMKRKMFYNLVMNQLLVYPLFISLTGVIGVKQRFHDFPSFWQILGQLCIIYYLDDLFFYWGHRTFHSFKTLYKMHKIHHQYDKVFTFTTQYFHPFDYAVANVLPAAIGLLLLGGRAHCFTYFFWMAYKISLSTEGHSGYQFPWSPVRMLPFVLGPCFHDHHHSHNVGNYSGSCYMWDLLLGTGQHFFKQYLQNDKQKAVEVGNNPQG